jgi:hypothetical protein
MGFMACLPRESPMLGIFLARDTDVGNFETFVLATVRRATIAAFASAVAITACSAASPDQSSTDQSRRVATSTVDESSRAAKERHALYPGSGSLMVDSPEQCEPGKYWSQWKYTNMDFESIMACKR